MMKYRFEKNVFIRKNFLLIVRESENVRFRDRFSGASNTRKQMKFDAFTFRQFFQFEQVIRDTISIDETVSSEIERILHRADSAPKRERGKKRKKKRKRKREKRRKKKIMKMIRHRWAEMLKKRDYNQKSKK